MLFSYAQPALPFWVDNFQISKSDAGLSATCASGRSIARIAGSTIIPGSCVHDTADGPIVCDLCPPGFASTTGAACVQCGIGTRSIGTACVSSCPLGQRDQNNGTGALSCAACPALYVLSASGVCVGCQPGAITTDGLTCTVCADGSFVSGASCARCPAGSFCVGGSNPVPCNATQFSPVGASACQSCPVGTVVSPVQATARSYLTADGRGAICVPLPCPVGFTMSPAGSCGPCAAGSYSVAGVCVPCPAGAFSQPGASNCMVRPLHSWRAGLTHAPRLMHFT